MSFFKDLGQFIWRDDSGKISPSRFISVISQVMLLFMIVLVYFGLQIPFMYWMVLCGLTGNRSLIFVVTHLTEHFQKMNVTQVNIPQVDDLVDKDTNAHTQRFTTIQCIGTKAY